MKLFKYLQTKIKYHRSAKITKEEIFVYVNKYATSTVLSLKYMGISDWTLSIDLPSFSPKSYLDYLLTVRQHLYVPMIELH